MSIRSIKEIKRYILAIIEEYSTNDLYTSDDEDINKRLIPLINIHYQMLFNQSENIKAKKIEVKIDNEMSRDEYKPYSLGSLCAKFLGIRVIKSDYKDIDYYSLNKKLYIKNNYEGLIEAQYKPYCEDLSEIPNEKLDETELDLDVNSVIVLCYHVASDVLKTDVGADYTAFDQKASKVISALDITKNGVMGIVRPVKIYGGGL